MQLGLLAFFYLALLSAEVWEGDYVFMWLMWLLSAKFLSVVNIGIVYVGAQFKLWLKLFKPKIGSEFSLSHTHHDKLKQREE